MGKSPWFRFSMIARVRLQLLGAPGRILRENSHEGSLDVMGTRYEATLDNSRHFEKLEAPRIRRLLLQSVCWKPIEKR